MNDSFDKTISGGKFDEVFTEVSHAETLGLKNPEQLRLFHLNVNTMHSPPISLKCFSGRTSVNTFFLVLRSRTIMLRAMCTA